VMRVIPVLRGVCSFVKSGESIDRSGGAEN
jgi:hypothetical protein